MPYVEYEEPAAICSECEMTFRSEEALDRHRVEVHAPARAAMPGVKPKNAARPAASSPEPP
jgi:hypothetical protein